MKTKQPRVQTLLLATDLMRRRRELGFDQRRAAEEIGVSASTICRVETERGLPDLESFARLCSWLGVTPGTYLGLTKLPRAKPQCGRCERIRKLLEEP
jgi:transcriptional regulator with XRE-family HTH domain